MERVERRVDKPSEVNSLSDTLSRFSGLCPRIRGTVDLISSVLKTYVAYH